MRWNPCLIVVIVVLTWMSTQAHGTNDNVARLRDALQNSDVNIDAVQPEWRKSELRNWLLGNTVPKRSVHPRPNDHLQKWLRGDVQPQRLVPVPVQSNEEFQKWLLK